MSCSSKTVLFVLLSVAIQTPSVWTCRWKRCSCDRVQPYIGCPGSVGTVYGSLQQRQVSICWTKPVAGDNCCLQSVTQTSGLPSCSSFGSGQHSVVYTARDCSGNTATCVMSFTVAIVTCPYMDYPANAQSIIYSSLYQQPVYGDTAIITCKAGYTLAGTSTQICLANGSWSAGGSSAITCTVIMCSTAIPIPANIHLVSTTGYGYGSVATLACNNQLTMTEGQTYLTCQLSGEWSTTSALCIDIVPPVIWGCPASFHQYSDRDLNYTRVSWTEPTATDNLDTSVTVTLTTGSPPGSIFFESHVPYTIRYDAQDSAGNAALLCIFTIVISGLTCDPLGIPMSAHEWQKCANGYRWGSTCTLGCFDGYPLVGPSTVTCDVSSTSTPTPLWNWGPSGNASYCQVIQCPPLNTPKNGALACSTWTNGPLCQLQCNIKYDIPEMAAAALGLGVGMYACSTITGTWMPPPPVPDCLIKHFPGDTYKMNILSYYSGDCSTPAAQAQIANNFIKILNDTSSAFKSACINVPACTASNVQVTCGASGRKKRQVEEAVAFTVTFKLTIYLPDNITLEGTAVYNMVSSIFDAMTNQVQDDVDEGKYDTLGIPGVQVDQSSYIYSGTKLNCSLGMAPRLNSFTCAPCGQGTFFNTTTGKCEWCNKGTYQDDEGQFRCKACPATYSTLDIAATSASQCLPPCPAGSYSQSGLQPCGLCQPGYYQSSIGQTSCLQCPPGQGSVVPGAVDALACKAYEMRFTCPNSQLIYPLNITGTVRKYSVRFWVAVSLAGTNTGQLMKITQGSRLLFQLTNPRALTIKYLTTTLSTGKSIADTKWHMMTVVMDAVACTMTLYDGVTKFYTRKSTNICQLSLSAVITVTLGSAAGSVQGSILLFSLTASTIVPVLPPSGRCQYDDSAAIVRWKDLLNVQNAVCVAVALSKCGATSPCLPNPCSRYGTCDITADYEYMCKCSANYAGPTCAVPPNYCKGITCLNGGTCVSKAPTFKCTCRIGYMGVYCEVRIVNGVWCPWEDWSQCNATCGGGIQQRARQCACPAPQSKGQPCQGNPTQVQACNTQSCGTCPSLPTIPPNVLINCTFADFKSCHIACKEGYVFNGTVQVYNTNCSRDTNYQWSVAINSLPVCQKTDLAQNISVMTVVSYPALPCTSLQSFQSSIMASLDRLNSPTGCFNDTLCQTSVETMMCSGSGYETNTTLVYITYTVPTVPGSFWLNGQLRTDFAQEAVNTMWSRLIDVSNASQALLNAVGNRQLSYGDYAPYDNPTAISTVICPSGMINFNNFCTQCKAGYYQESIWCLPCSPGYYQPNPGQTFCFRCPTGYTSHTQAAVRCTVTK